MSQLLRIARNVADLDAMRAFYESALGFDTIGMIDDDSALADLLGASHARSARLQLGSQQIELTALEPFEPTPEFQGHETGFQHIALTTNDIASACEKVLAHGAVAITRAGPQQLPERSGGVVAFKFRDPEGHPLELIQFPQCRPPGYDHSAISVANISATLNFYARLGINQTSHGINQGREQDALDRLSHVTVDVIALMPSVASPHVELLHYRNPTCLVSTRRSVLSLAADRLIFKSQVPGLLHDPDGHAIILEP